MIEVSIIIPIFNAGLYLKETLESIEAQTMENWEAILINDGSRDSSWDMMREFARKTNRVKLYSQVNQGPGVARNKGLRCARGRYIAFVDADDIIERDYLKRMTETARKTNAEVVVCGARKFDNYQKTYTNMSSAVRPDLLSTDQKYFTPEEESEWLFQITGNNLYNKLFSRKLIEKTGLRFSARYKFEYLLVVLNAIMQAERIAISGEEMVTIRTGNSRSLMGQPDRHIDDIIDSFYEMQQVFENGGIYEKYCRTFYRFLFGAVCALIDTCIETESVGKLFAFSRTLYNCKTQKYVYRENFLYEMEYLKCKLLLESESALEFILGERNLRTEQLLFNNYRVFMFPYDRVPRGSKIVIFGANQAGIDLYTQARQTSFCNITIWVDDMIEKFRYRGLPVVKLDEIDTKDFDYILICAGEDDDEARMIGQILDHGISYDKIILYRPQIDKDAYITGMESEGD